MRAKPEKAALSLRIVVFCPAPTSLTLLPEKNHDEVLTKLTKEIGNLTTKVDNLEKENETLTKVLQGRDDQTQVFYKKAFEAMEVAAKTFSLVDTMNKNHTELMKMLVEHLKPGVTINNQPNK